MSGYDDSAIDKKNLRFLPEQDGPAEWCWEAVLCDIFHVGSEVRRAYLVRVVDKDRGREGAVLCLSARRKMSQATHQRIADSFARVFSPDVFLDVIEVDGQAEREVRRIARPFYQQEDEVARIVHAAEGSRDMRAQPYWRHDGHQGGRIPSRPDSNRKESETKAKRKLVVRFVLALLSPAIVLGILFAINIPHLANIAGSTLMCKNTLLETSLAFDLYRADHDGAYPPSLADLGAYMEGKYSRGAGNPPICPGSRGDDETSTSSDYVYHIPSRGDEVVPICWDGKPHRGKMVGLSDSIRWNVLYSDGHVGLLTSRELIETLTIIAEDNPGLLQSVDVPVESRDGVLGALLLGVPMGIAVLAFVGYCRSTTRLQGQ